MHHPRTSHSPSPASTDRFHFNFLPFSFLFLGCLDTSLTNAKGDAKLQEPASCQRATTLSHSSPLSGQLAARNMCAKFTLEKHLENAVACKFFGMRRSAAAEWRRKGWRRRLHINLCAACHDALHMTAIAARLCMLHAAASAGGRWR